MSKQTRKIFYSFAVIALILQFFYNSPAQNFETVIKIEKPESRILTISGKFAENAEQKKAKNLSFLLSYAGFENLGARVSNVRLFDDAGREIAYKKLIDGEYLAEREFARWQYEIAPNQPQKPTPHLSWLAAANGILMLDDLLPQFADKENPTTAAKVTLELPPNWTAATNEKLLSENVYEVANVEKAIFYIGANQREKTVALENFTARLTIAGEWLFTDDEAAEMTREILTKYTNLFGAFPNEKARIFLIKSEAENGRWEAETRGANVTIISSDMPFKKQSLQRLHEQLRHEIFHLWTPNNLNLSGNYDWFYEGFALYQSLRTGIEVNKLSFADYLDTLARAHSVDSLQTQKTSLLAASKNRWSGANTQVYARGMLVAFLCDLAVLQKSKGKRSLSEILRKVYENHRFPNARQDGNAAVLKILESYAELRPIIEKYVKGTEKIVWQTELDAFGIESREENFMTKLSVKTKPNGRQKDLLDKLGYNNWRKLSQSSK